MASKKSEVSRDAQQVRRGKDERFAANGRSPQAQHILAATYRVLAKNGFAALSMSKIAAEAKVNKRMLHYYFDTKERLIEEMATSLGDLIVNQLAETSVGFVGDPGAVFTIGIDRAWEVVTQNRELVAAYHSIASQAVFDERLAKALHRNKQSVRDTMVADLEALVATGHWRLKAPPSVIAEMTVAMFQGFVIEWVERGEDDDLRQALNATRRLILSMGEPIS